MILACLKGTCFFLLALALSWFHLRASRHLPSVMSEELIATLSLSRRPSLPVLWALSLPARSTKDTEDRHSPVPASAMLISTTAWLLLLLLFIPVGACLR